ncbi:inovirus Gp2 family protein [Zobellella iuensis]|uniref:Inovirus Gp2 family protein n=1 Tax=Zobellella iuensis TaxID=2803811 RepID=A0ABS1QQP6_9GAMM|nr:inovirus Gp2 family protein [Zobellella iuensis]
MRTNKTETNHRQADKVVAVIDRALADHPRTIAIRFDLRFPWDLLDSLYSDSPSQHFRADREVITRFFKSLKSKISHSLSRRKREGKRVHPTNVRYIWCREINDSVHCHYHVLILLNKDTFQSPGNYRLIDSGLSGMVYSAWASAIELCIEDAFRLVHFPENSNYTINKNADRHLFEEDYNSLVNRALYLAKAFSKYTADGGRSFGTSQN